MNCAKKNIAKKSKKITKSLLLLLAVHGKCGGMSTGDVVPRRPADRLPVAAVGRRSVRRSLFGRLDPEETLNFAKRELEKQMLRDQEKWNFDFINERPLNGPGKRYEWVKVEEPGASRLSGDGHGTPESVNGTCEDHHDRTGGGNGQTHITDFMRKRRHSPLHSKRESSTTTPATTTSSPASPSPPIVKSTRRSST